MGGGKFGEIVHEGHRSTRQLARNTRTAHFRGLFRVKIATTKLNENTSHPRFVLGGFLYEAAGVHHSGVTLG